MLRGLIPSSLMLLLCYYWFGVANRHAVFLYQHVDRPGDPPALAFDPITSSRYWMAPWVAAGLICVLLLAFDAWNRSSHRRRRCAWTRAWLSGAACLLPGLPAITMHLNHPTLPAELALRVTLSGLLGLALALAVSEAFFERPRQSIGVALESLGLLVPLLALRAVELPARGILSPALAASLALGSLALGGVWLRSVGMLATREGLPRTGSLQLTLAAYSWALLGFPIAHHLLATPSGFRYITSASNVFGHDPRVALSSGLCVLTLAAIRPAARAAV